MRILITGACGFVGSQIIERLQQTVKGVEIFGLDNYCRAGSERNRSLLQARGVKLFHGDVRSASDFESLPAVDYVIDASANPSVLAGVDGRTSSRQLIEHNLLSTANILEFCRRHGAGFVLLSTSRVYSIVELAGLPLAVQGERMRLDASRSFPAGLSDRGVTENFSTTPPLSLYGVSKKASEDLALEYGHTFGFPVWINRCGVMAGAGQFGRPDQGIVAYWIHSWREQRPLKYIGFGGHGHQVRDVLHPHDLADLLVKQMAFTSSGRPQVCNVSGGMESAFSLAELSGWCREHLGYDHPISAVPENRAFDIPWLILDDSQGRAAWDWQPQISRDQIFESMARFAMDQPAWLQVSAGN